MEIPKHLCDEIALESMIESYFGLKRDLENDRWPIFVRDKQEDKALIQAYLDAFKMVIGYYGGKVE
jgi:hypothetical protein